MHGRYFIGWFEICLHSLFLHKIQSKVRYVYWSVNIWIQRISKDRQRNWPSIKTNFRCTGHFKIFTHILDSTQKELKFDSQPYQYSKQDFNLVVSIVWGLILPPLAATNSFLSSYSLTSFKHALMAPWFETGTSPKSVCPPALKSAQNVTKENQLSSVSLPCHLSPL